nr:putative ribonuclease H-like domain-containing protein [Tanacetum cinerariifolium]
MLMARIQPADGNTKTVPSYDTKVVSQVNVSSKANGQVIHVKSKTIIHTSDDDQIDSSIIFDDPHVENNDFSDDSINEVNAANSLVPVVGHISINNINIFSAASPSYTVVSPTHGKSSYVNTSQYIDDLNMPELEDITYFDDEVDVDPEADFTNLETTITVSLIPTTRVHKDHHVTQIIGDLSLATQTRSMKREEGIDYEEVFAPVARIEAIRLFLAYSSFMGFMVYQMDVKSAFMYGTIKKEVIQLVLWIVDSGCSIHVTGNLQLLRNFVEKFMGTAGIKVSTVLTEDLGVFT